MAHQNEYVVCFWWRLQHNNSTNYKKISTVIVISFIGYLHWQVEETFKNDNNIREGQDNSENKGQVT